MSNEKQEAPFLNETGILRDTLITAQAQLDDLAIAGDNVTTTYPAGVKFSHRVNIGQVTEAFSNFARAVFEYDAKLEQAIEQVKFTQVKEPTSES